MLTEVDYGKSPVFMNNAELKKEIWRLKGIIERKESELKQLKTIVTQVQKAEIVIDRKWENRYRKLLTLYKSIKLKKPVPIEYTGDHEQIVNAVCQYYGYALSELQTKSRKRKFVRPRQVLCYLLYGAGVTLSDIGNLIGGRDHSTVIHGRDTVISQFSTFTIGEQNLIKTLTEN